MYVILSSTFPVSLRKERRGNIVPHNKGLYDHVQGEFLSAERALVILERENRDRRRRRPHPVGGRGDDIDTQASSFGLNAGAARSSS